MRSNRYHGLVGSDPDRIAGETLSEGIVARVWAFARPYRSMLVGFLVTIILASVLSLVPPLLFRSIIDQALPQKDTGLLALLAGIVIVAAFIEAGLSLLERWWSARIGEGLIFDLRSALFDHVQHMPIAFFTRTQTGALISRLNNDVIGAQRALTGTLGSVVSNIIVLITTLVAMVALDWRLTLLALFMLPIFIIPAKRVGRRLQAITREGMDLNADMNTTMTERFNVSGALLVKLFGRHTEESTEFSNRARRVADIGVKSAVLNRAFFIALGLVGAVGTAIVYWVGGHQVISEAITIGTLVALATLVTRIYEPLTSLTNARVDIMTAFVSFDRVFEVLDLPNPLEDSAEAVELEGVDGSIEFDHVSFTYPSAAEVSLRSLEAGTGYETESEHGEVLHDISLSIHPGQLVAVVGPSGAGKSTLSSLIPRLYDVTSGSLRVGGTDVREVTRDSLRRSMGVVTQDPHLFHTSIRQNLLYAKPDATDDHLVAACRAAQIHELIAGLPDGYETLVGERGYRMSGGEKQRLAIARMLLKDPAIVILDEATSHLDSENEALVQQALATALEGRTAVVIAHRLSTITSADLIVVLDRGRIVETGRHEDLVANNGLYSELYATLVRAEPEPAA
ncbi:MAG: putative multidrug export ATP-binding/permease protein [Acidimicrobiales bacterium]|nr:MAG: ABC transporter ATP-binding protein [Actinomycetota bacterium]MBV6510449.1 putative multidrug export ATP-binding/permease protein [Acidimicrobiales bacterium]RIK03747.1 MAG: ABC transporter [Acidobacteriota bacterium]